MPTPLAKHSISGLGRFEFLNEQSKSQAKALKILQVSCDSCHERRRCLFYPMHLQVARTPTPDSDLGPSGLYYASNSASSFADQTRDEVEAFGGHGGSGSISFALAGLSWSWS